MSENLAILDNYNAEILGTVAVANERWTELLAYTVRSLSFDRWYDSVRSGSMSWLWKTEAMYWMDRDTQRTLYQLSWGIKRWTPTSMNGTPLVGVAGITNDREELHQA